jgi:hypothetical protein
VPSLISLLPRRRVCEGMLANFHPLEAGPEPFDTFLF